MKIDSFFQFGAVILVLMICLSGCRSSAPQLDRAQLRQQVLKTERAFAHTMKVRDFQAFTSFLSDEAVFFSGKKELRGKLEIAMSWARYYKSPDAPFSWEPESVAVLDSGTLALSTGPVYNSTGKQIATFTSIWRQEAPGEWRIIFDRGTRFCDAPKTE